jgi:hypothetical protein
VYASTPSTNLDRGLPSRVARVPSHGSRSPDASAGSRLKATVPGRLLEAQSSTPGPDTLSVKTGRSLAPRSHSSPRHDHRAASHHRSLATTPSPPPARPNDDTLDSPCVPKENAALRSVPLPHLSPRPQPRLRSAIHRRPPDVSTRCGVRATPSVTTLPKPLTPFDRHSSYRLLAEYPPEYRWFLKCMNRHLHCLR